MLMRKIPGLTRSCNSTQKLQQALSRSLSSTSHSLSATKVPGQETPEAPHKKQDEPAESFHTRQPSTEKTKSVSQSDAELRERMEQMSGEGGAAGIEYEDGKPNTMKRGVRNNMFRLI